MCILTQIFPTAFVPRLAEASCASVVRTAKAVVADVGVAAASSSTGLTDLASRTEKKCRERLP